MTVTEIVNDLYMHHAISSFTDWEYNFILNMKHNYVNNELVHFLTLSQKEHIKRLGVKYEVSKREQVQLEVPKRKTTLSWKGRIMASIRSYWRD